MLKHSIALIIFIAISAIYSNTHFVYTEQHLVENQTVSPNTLWDDSSLSGCPTVAHNNIANANLFGKISETAATSCNSTTAFFIMLLTLIGIYILLSTLKINQLSATVGSIVFGLFSYNIAELQAGGISEMLAICTMPYIISGIILIFNGKKIIGTSTLLIASALQAATCHYQIMYYTLFIALAYIIYEIISRRTRAMEKVAGIALTIAAICIALFTNSETMFQEYDYSQYAEKPTPDYNISAPYFNDEGETLSLLIGDIKGGKSNRKLTQSSETYNLLEPLFGQENAQKIANESPIYFGKKFFCNGAPYIGALALLLAIFGSICSKNKNKWWIIATVVISIILSCGNIEYFIIRNLPLFYNFNHFSNILIIAALGISILAALGTEEIINGDILTDEKSKAVSLYISAGILTIVLLLFVIFPAIAGDYSIDQNHNAEVGVSEMLASYMPQDAEYAEAVTEFKNDYINAIRTDRLSLIRKDAAKSLVFTLLGAITIFFALRKKVKTEIVAATIIVLVAADSSLTNFKLSSTNSGKSKSENTTEIQRNDKVEYRTIDIRYDVVQNDYTTHTRHNSLWGDGYCLKRYMTFCDSLLNKELALTRYNILSWSQRDGMTTDEIQQVFSEKYKTPMLDMLNVRHIILSAKSAPLENTHASGNAWLTDSIRWVGSEIMELAKLQHIDTKRTAVVNEKYKSEFTDVEFAIDSTDFIKLVSHNGDTLKYQSSSKGNRLAVFSEIFYPRGWKATIDGNKASLFRCNYILRGMIIPQGKHEIVFCYAPKTAAIGKIVSMACNVATFSIIAIMCIIGLTRRLCKRKQKQDHETEIQ